MSSSGTFGYIPSTTLITNLKKWNGQVRCFEASELGGVIDRIEWKHIFKVYWKCNVYTIIPLISWQKWQSEFFIKFSKVFPIVLQKKNIWFLMVFPIVQICENTEKIYAIQKFFIKFLKVFTIVLHFLFFVFLMVFPIVLVHQIHQKKWDFEIFDEIWSGFEHGNQPKIEKIFLKFFSIVTFHENFQKFKKSCSNLQHQTSFSWYFMKKATHLYGFSNFFWELKKNVFALSIRGGSFGMKNFASFEIWWGGFFSEKKNSKKVGNKCALSRKKKKKK